MPYFAELNPSGVCIAVSEQPAIPQGPQFVPLEGLDLGVLGRTFSGGQWQPAPPPPADPAEWLIDVGPFMDRFGLAKLAVLASTNATVRALVTDILARRWIDLQRADVAAGIDLIIGAGVPGVDGTLKTAILTTPVQPAENLALRRLYFGG